MTTVLIATPAVGHWKGDGIALLWTVGVGLPSVFYMPRLRSRDILINMAYTPVIAWFLYAVGLGTPS